jgi:hypothetical protein
MGKAGNKKRDRRIAETTEQYQDAVATRTEQQVLRSRDDAQLFTVDRTGSKNARRRIEKELEEATTKHSVSKTEHNIIKKKMAAIEAAKKLGAPTEAAAKKAKAAARAGAGSVVKRGVQKPMPVLSDVWGEDDETAVGGKRTAAANIVDETSKRRAVMARKEPQAKRKIDAPGFSYNPDEAQHQDLLAEALGLELRALEKKARAEGKFTDAIKDGVANMGDSTRKVEEADEEDDEESEAEISEEEGDGDKDKAAASTGSKRKLSRKQRLQLERKTKAQRNKEKNKRKALYDLQKLQGMQRLLKTLKQVPAMLNELDKREAVAEAQKAIKELQLEEKAEEAAKALTYLEAKDVPLTDELGDGLRTLRPKGNRLSGMQDLLIHSNDAVSRTHRNFKKGEHPHKAKNVKWVAKHKYIER